MTLEEVFAMWETDSKIDSTELGRESLSIPRLHHKWYRAFSEERLRLKKITIALEALRHKKTVFYTSGTDEESRRSNWEMPARGKILKSEVKQWVDADQDVLEMGISLAEQAEVVRAMEDIIQVINNRSFHITAAIRWEEFTNGVSR